MITQRLLATGLLGTALAFGATPARASNDTVQFGSNIHVTPDSTVHDAVCFFCSINIEGKVTGDVVVFFGNIHIAGDAQHDVVNFFGEVRAEDDASVGNNLVSIFGSIGLGENVTVGNDLVAIFGSLRAPATVTVGGERVVQPGWVFFGPLILMFLVVFLIIREYRSYRRRLLLRGYPFPPRQ